MSKDISKNKDLSCLIIAIVIGVFVKLALPDANGLTDKGVSFLAIFIGTMFLWVTCDTVWPSLLSLVAFGVFRVVDVSDMFAASFGNNFVAMLIGSLILAAALNESGAMEFIAKWCLTRKGIKGHPFVFLLYETLVVYIISIMTSAFLAVIILLPICTKLLRSIGIKKEDNMMRASIFVIMWFTVGGELMLPFGKSMPLLIINYINSFGFEFSIGRYMLFSIPFFIIYTALGFLIIKLAVRPDAAGFTDYDTGEFERDMIAHPLTKAGKLCIAATIATMIIIILPMCSFIPTVSEYFASYESSLAFFLPAAVLCVVRADGRPAIDLRVIGQKINWGIVLFFATMFFYVNYIGSEEFGITKWLAGVLSPVADMTSPIVLLIIAAFVTAVMTNFISNMVSLALNVSLFVPIFQMMAARGMTNIPVFAVVFVIGIAANVAFITPGAGIVAGIIYPSNELDVKKSLLPNTLMLIISVIALIVATLVISIII